MMSTAIRVLYVDDEPDLLELGKMYLEQSGDFTVTTITNAPEAIRLLEQETFDAIIADYQMPGMDGIQFLIEVRTRFGPIPFILFTGRGREEVVIQAINSGADFYLQKGGEPKAQFAELSHKIKSAASRKRADDALRESEERHRTILQTTMDGIWMVDADGKITDVNETYCRMSGYTRADLLNLHVSDLDAVEKPAETAAHIQRIIGNGSGFFETRHRRKDGSVFDVEVSTMYLDADGGKFICFCRDVTGRKRAEDALKNEKQRLENIIEGTRAGTWEWNVQTGETIFNEQWAGIIGYTLSEISPVSINTWMYYAHPDDLQKSGELLDRHFLRESEWYEYESRMKHKNGHWVWVLDRGKVASWTKDGKPLWMFGTHLDITERKQAEKTLLDVIDKNPMSIQIVDKEGYVLKVNSAHTRLFGAVPPSNYTIFDDFQLKQQGYTELLERAKNGEVVTFPEIFYNAHNVDPKFSDVPVWIRMVIFPINDSYGKPERFVTMHDNITERKRAEDALLKSEEKYRTVFFTSPNSICITRLSDGMFISINKGFTEITGYTEEDVAGKTSLEINIWKDPEDRRKIVEGLKANGEVRNYEARFLTKTGEICGVMSTSIIELNGVPHILNITHDITGRKRAEEALQKNTEELHAAFEELTSSEEELRQNVDDLARGEQALRNLNTYNRVLLEASLDPLVTINSDGKIADVNTSTEKVTGYSREELIGTDFPDYFTEPEKAREGYLRVFTDGTVRDYPLEIQHKDGHITPVLHNASVYRDEMGKVCGVFAAARDITERKLAEEVLEKNTDELNAANEELTAADEELRAMIEDLGTSEKVMRTLSAYNRNLLETSLDPLVTISPEGKITDVNAATERVTGYSRTELVETDFSNYFTEPDQAREGYQQVFTDGTIRDYPLEIRHRDGHITPVLYNASVYRDETGKVRGVFAAARDITDRKLAEEALQKSKRELADIVSFLPDATLVIDKNGTVLAWNRAMEEMTGVPAEQIIGKANYEYALPFYHERRPITIDLVLHDDPAVVAKYPVMKKDGSTLFSEIFIPHLNNGRGAYLAFKASPLYDNHGNLTGAIESIRDITERKMVAEALQQANKKLNLLSSITRHDINNQLAVLQGYISLLEMQQPNPKLNEYLHKVTTAAERISAMIQFTKEYESVGVNSPVWQDCRTLLATAAKEAPLGQVTVKNDLPAGTEVFADPLVVKVFYNLLDNAVRYGGKITNIRFSNEKRDGDHIIVCEDDGDGVVAEEKEKIFERGFGKNTGLGLTLAREILGITGITICENGIPGKGARFEMTVPKGMWRMTGASE